MGLYDNNLNVVVEYAYDSWGNVVSITGSLASTLGQDNPFRYRGYYFDSETGLYYLNSRYYDSNAGRFINADGLVQTGQGVLDKNMFAYCMNNPVMFIDPTGKSIGLALLGLALLGGSMLFLSGCSANKVPSDYRQNDTNSQNCYSYAFNLDGIRNPGDYSFNGNNSIFSVDETYTIDEMSDYVTRDMKSLGKSVRIVSSPESKKSSERIVAMKVIQTDSPKKFDYHFAMQLSNGKWADKLGFLPSRYNKIDGTAISWEVNELKTYDSDTVYFAIED